MAEKKDIKDKTKRIHDLLPKLDDQRCGYRSCGEFARAVAEWKAPCYGCVSGGPDVAAMVCELMGTRVPEVAITGFRSGPGFYQPGILGGGGMGGAMERGIRQRMGRGLGGRRGTGQGRGIAPGGGMGRGFRRGRRGR